jgi:hypothetical protein
VSFYQEGQAVECLGRGGEILGGYEAVFLVGSSKLVVCLVGLMSLLWFALFSSPELGNVHISDLAVLLGQYL